jgi:uncharacterized membrane protein YkvA (DUF1232 family)
MKKPSGTPWGSVLPLLMALVYGVSPIDLIPDIIPILGLFDDAIVVPILLILALVQYRKRQTAVKANQRGSLRIPGA